MLWLQPLCYSDYRYYSDNTYVGVLVWYSGKTGRCLCKKSTMPNIGGMMGPPQVEMWSTNDDVDIFSNMILICQACCSAKNALMLQAQD